MAKKRRRHAMACKFRIALEALEGSKTIWQILNYRTMAEERFLLCWGAGHIHLEPIIFPVLLSKD